MSAPATEHAGMAAVEPTKASAENVEKANKLKEQGQQTTLAQPSADVTMPPTTTRQHQQCAPANATSTR
jgi:hypothetical protein